MTGNITLKYSWWRWDDKPVKPEHQTALAEHAWERMVSQIAEGYHSGELLTEINNISYRGWWDKEETNA